MHALVRTHLHTRAHTRNLPLPRACIPVAGFDLHLHLHYPHSRPFHLNRIPTRASCLS
ncbi:hypothetical protein K438DRAFT_1856295 [Mycena galopus ATCC 62051]|nr:hypothetical protein K438DRAFT_1856295 [Mycena galopus ATCC 62051]